MSVSHELLPSPAPGSVTVRDLALRPIPFRVAREVLTREHYLHSFPGGTALAIGVFAGDRLVGVVTLGNGPRDFSRTVEGARQRDCLVLTRLWLHEECPRNSESHVLSLLIRALRMETELKFLVSYADPAIANANGTSHVGFVYQSSNWAYIGMSNAMPYLDLGDGKPRHLRSVNSLFGTHSVHYLQASGLDVRTIAQSAKHTYLFFLDRRWRKRLLVPVLPYPKPSVEVTRDGDHQHSFE